MWTVLRQHPARAVGMLALLCLFLVPGCGPLVDPGALQNRASLPAERLRSGQTLVQTFVATRDRLSVVEVLVAVYTGDGDASGDLTLSLVEAEGTQVASTRLSVSAAKHNSSLRLEFEPRTGSLGKSYQLRLESSGEQPARATLWRAEDDAYPDGRLLLDGKQTDGDLVFRAYYDYAPSQLLSDLAEALGSGAWPLLILGAILVLPGLAIERWFLRELDFDFGEAAGAWIGLSLAFWAVLLLATTTVGLRLSAQSSGAILALSALLSALAILRGNNTALKTQSAKRRGLMSVWSPSSGIVVATVAALVVRFIHARDLVLPMWVDPIHHTLIAGLIAESGRVPTDYGPFVPAQPFTYHFGFHLPVALLNWLGGVDPWLGVLIVGQLLGGLAVCSTYLLASRVCGDKRAGLVAGVVVGLVSTMPAYYVSWGRYPQLAGLVVLPVAFVTCAGLWGRHKRSLVMPVAVVAISGLVLAHPRVALLLAALLAADVFLHLWANRFNITLTARALASYLAVGVAGGVLLLPWLLRLSTSVVATEGLPRATSADPASIPGQLLAAGFPSAVDRYVVAAAAVAVVTGLVWRRRWALLCLLWLVGCVILANPSLIGLPFSFALSNHALGIALFLPASILVGALAADTSRLFGGRLQPLTGQLALAVPLLVMAAWGAGNLISVVNPTCLLVTSSDVKALRWVADYTPTSASFLINGRRWQGEISAGTDAGYWLPAIAKRRASLPPQPYAHAGADDVQRINALADRLAEPPAETAAEIWEIMNAEGFSHVFVGALGGPLHRETFLSSPLFTLEYDNGRASVFAKVD